MLNVINYRGHKNSNSFSVFQKVGISESRYFRIHEIKFYKMIINLFYIYDLYQHQDS